MAEPADPTGDNTQAAPEAGHGAAALKWYIVHIYSGHENKARLTLLERVRNANLNEFFGEVLVPTESVMELVKGQRRTTTRKFFPGYMFVQMVMDDRTFHLVKNTPKITGFLGGTKPTPVPEREITGLQSNITEGKQRPKAKVTFEVGEEVKITDGAFANLTGRVDEVDPARGKLKISVSIFGRFTPVELEYWQVQRASES